MPFLNYKYAIFPTATQRRHLSRQMRECRIQYNRAVRTRKRLQGSIRCGHVGSVLAEIFSLPRADANANRQAAITRVAFVHPDLPEEHRPRFYDLSGIFGKVFPVEPRHCDLAVLTAELEPLLRAEQRAYHQHRRSVAADRPKKGPKCPLYFALLRAASDYAGYEAKSFIDRAFQPIDGVARSAVRFSVSGARSGNASHFERACRPSADQRAQGNTGEPQFRKRVQSYGYQELAHPLEGCKLRLKGLPAGMALVRVRWHRPLPPDAKIKRVTVMEGGLGYYAVLTLEVSPEVYRLIPAYPARFIGLDPGSSTALTAAAVATDTGEITYRSWDWHPLEDALDHLEQISQQLSDKQGPDRRHHRPASNRWKKLNRERTRLHAHIVNRRQDMHHKISRALVDNGFVAIGDWEPPKKVKGRKAFKEGEAESVPHGPKGVRGIRRDGRDRAIASLRMLTEQKGERAGVVVMPRANERYSTRRCSVCGSMTGPVNDTSVREWTCPDCGTRHDRDQNAAMNIATKAIADYRRKASS